MKKLASLRIGVVKEQSCRSLSLRAILKPPLKGLRLLISVTRNLLKFLLVVLALLVIIEQASFLKSNAASLTDNRYRYSYFTNGDFVQDGLDKHFVFYEYLPDGLSWDTLNQMVVNITADGVRCDYRVFGYRSGGGGTLVYDSGGRGQFGQAIDITGANFDYYNVIVSAYDDTGTQIQVGTIDSAYIIFAYGELVQLPTTPPELVEHAASIDDAINGGIDEQVPTQDIELPTMDNSSIGPIEVGDQAMSMFAMFGSVSSAFFLMSGIGSILVACVVLSVIYYFLYGRR